MSPTGFHLNTFCLVSSSLHAATTKPPPARLAVQRAPATVEVASTAQGVAAAHTGRARHAPTTAAAASTGLAAQASALAHAPIAARVVPAKSEQAAATSILAPAPPANLGELFFYFYFEMCTFVCLRWLPPQQTCHSRFFPCPLTHAHTTASTRRPRPARPAALAVVAPLASTAQAVVAATPVRARLAQAAALASTGRAALASARARAPAAPTTALQDSTACSART